MDYTAVVTMADKRQSTSRVAYLEMLVDKNAFEVLAGEKKVIALPVNSTNMTIMSIDVVCSSENFKIFINKDDTEVFDGSTVIGPNIGNKYLGLKDVVNFMIRKHINETDKNLYLVFENLDTINNSGNIYVRWVMEDWDKDNYNNYRF